MGGLRESVPMYVHCFLLTCQDIGGGVTDRIVIGSAFGGATSNGGVCVCVEANLHSIMMTSLILFPR